MKIIVVKGKVDGLTALYEFFIKNSGWFRKVEQHEEDCNPERNPLFPEQKGFPSKRKVVTYQLYLDGEFLDCRQTFVYDLRNDYAHCQMDKKSKDILDNAVSKASVKPFNMPTEKTEPIAKSRSI